jgi:hypothetical protein
MVAQQAPISVRYVCTGCRLQRQKIRELIFFIRFFFICDFILLAALLA